MLLELTYEILKESKFSEKFIIVLNWYVSIYYLLFFYIYIYISIYIEYFFFNKKQSNFLTKNYVEATKIKINSFEHFHTFLELVCWNFKYSIFVNNIFFIAI